MTHAFDGGAFDSVAFDVDDVTVTTSAAYYFTGMWPVPEKVTDDDLLLAAWFAFMRQPYE